MKSDIRYTLSQVLTKPLPVFNHATEFNGIIHVSCIQGFRPGTMDLIHEGAMEQAEQIFKNLNIVLKEAGSDLTQVLKLNP